MFMKPPTTDILCEHICSLIIIVFIILSGI